MTFDSTNSSITVVVPNYNHAKYLEQSLSSIAAQTRQPDQVIIIDDASTDNSVEIIERFLVRYPDWQLIRNETNRGVIFGLNLGLNMTTAGWVTFLAADDALHPDYLDKMLAAAVADPTCGLICACVERFESAAVRELRPIVFPRMTAGLVSADDFRKLLGTADNFFLGTATSYRSDAAMALGGYDAQLGAFCDAMLARRLATRHGFVFLPEVLGFWRMHGENFSTTTSTDPVALGQKITRAKNILAAEPAGLFPRNYPGVFERRQRFGGARLFALLENQSAGARAERITALLQGGKREESFLRFLLSFGRAGITATMVWLTLRLRPMSLAVLLRQAATRRAIISRETGYRPSD
jgi:glycosyltransferase involved in cell wall biosynthesis